MQRTVLRTVWIEDGILKGYLQDTLNARLMNVPVTGNARRESYAHSFDESGDCSTEVQEQFQKNIDAFEQATWSQPFQVLVESGISLSAPDELADAELHAKLWEAINALALMGAYLEHTDHLSDRELALTRASGVAQKCLCCMSE